MAAAGAVVALVAGAEIRAVHADDLVPVQLAYEAPPGCPDADAFSREVLARAPRARLATPAEHSRSVLARVAPASAGGRGFDGVLVVREDAAVRGAAVRDAGTNGAPASERAVHAASCTELVTALAVIAAVVIDPMTAKTGAIDAGPATPSAAGDGGATSSADASTSTSTSTASGADAGGPPSAPPAVVEAPAAQPASSARRRTASNGGDRRERWEVSAGAGGGAIGGSAPTLLFSVPVFFEVARRAGGVVEPALRVRFERTATAPSEDGAFSRTGGAVDLCPLAVRARSLRAQPCARVELAALYAKGRDVEPVRSDVRPWFASGPVGRARLELGAPLFLELEGGFLVAMVRDRFFVEPGTLVYRAPLVGATTAFAMGLAF